MSTFNKLCVVGLGYIGLPTAAVFAKSGMSVVGVDVNSTTVETINSGKAHIVEVDLDGLILGVVENGNLVASTEPARADAFIIAVPTPFKEDKVPDLSYVEAATRSIAPFIRVGNVIILESTVPPGTTERMIDWIERERPDLATDGGVGKAYFLAHCPERVLPGRVLVELVQNDRIIGGITAKCAEKARQLYDVFLRGECHLSTARTAELAKLSENAFRDVNIAFANELSIICDDLDIDVWELVALANKHPRVNILQPGPGVGGHCIAVDPWFIVDSAPESSPLIRVAREINDSKPSFVQGKILEVVEKYDTPTVACLGLAFKADIDDLRSSPAVEIASQLAGTLQGEVLIVEPYISSLPSVFESTKARLVELTEATELADILVLLVDHKAFKGLDVSSRKFELIDTRGLYPAKLES